VRSVLPDVFGLTSNLEVAARAVRGCEAEFAVVAGASTGIGLEFAKRCAAEGFDLLIAADEPEIEQVAESLRRLGRDVKAIRADLATTEGMDQLYAATKDRPKDALLANAGRGLGHAFLDQDFGKVRAIIDTNITGTVYLVHKVGNDIRRRNSGRILITGSIVGFIPGSFQAVYNGTKAFLNSFSYALREELRDTDVTVTRLMPGATDTKFFERADMMDTAVGTADKDEAAGVAKIGFDAMMRGDGDIVSGLQNKAQSAVANVTPAGMLAKQHRKQSRAGYGGILRRQAVFRWLEIISSNSFEKFSQSPIPSGWVKISNEDSRATATNVIPYSSAALTAKAVGADIASSIGHPMAAVFCTSSIEIRLVMRMAPVRPGISWAARAPTSLSSALCRPTSSRIAISVPPGR
jgi:short-subunit dehydrogenase